MFFYMNRLRQLGVNILVLCLLSVVSICAHAYTVVLDPGHGGYDPGALGKVSKEKNINLKVALKVGELIKQNYPNIKVVYTRKTDVFIALDARATIAKKAKANVFISIHTNAIKGRRSISGAETYTLGMASASENLEVAKRENSVILYEKDNKERYAGYNGNSAESKIIFDFMQDQYMKQSAELAKSIQQQYAKVAKRTNRGVYQAGFLVLRELPMPSVLTELGYITNANEETYLNSANGVSALAKSIYEGFANYYKTHEIPNVKKKESSSQSNGENEKVASPDDSTQTQKRVGKPFFEEKLIDEIMENYQAANNHVENNSIEKDEVAENESTEENKAVENSNMKNVMMADNDIVEENKVAENANEITYRLRIFTSDKKMDANHIFFKGLSPIECYVENNSYKYTYGKTKSLEEIKSLKQTIAKKFPDAVIAAFKGNEPIPLQNVNRQQ